MTERNSRLLAILLGVGGVVVLTVVVLFLFNFAGANDEAMTTTIPTTMAGETTTSEMGTTAAASSTTTEVPATTTSSTTTTSSSTTTTSTTIETLPPLILESDGIGGVAFGVLPDEAIEYATAILGPAARDTGWVDSFSEFGTCPPPEVRGVQWGESPSGFGHAFTLLF
ncbi:MAG: hypothetical protein U9R47_03140, partial [Actinomycetota bacterium]|nr:hypothetical protein [Actinomycetota bacterium]